MMQPMSRTLAVLALVLSVGTVVAFGVLLQMFVPLGPAWYLSALALAVVLAAVAVAQSRRWLTVSALVVSMLVLARTAVIWLRSRIEGTPS